MQREKRFRIIFCKCRTSLDEKYMKFLKFGAVISTVLARV